MAFEQQLQMLILYASETGTAQDYAEQLWHDSRRRHLAAQVRCASMEYCTSLEQLHRCRVLVCICATTGQGDIPANMQAFWRLLLHKKLTTHSLAHLLCAVLGLGDSSYVRFNFAAKKLHRRLQQLGVRLLVELALADDQHPLGPDTIAQAWRLQFWNAYESMFPFPKDFVIMPEIDLLPSRFKIDCFANDLPTAGFGKIDSISAKLIDKNLQSVKVIRNARVTSEHHFQDTRLISFDISGSDIQYSPGDVAVVLPENLPDERQEFVELMQLNPESLLRATAANIPNCDIPEYLQVGVSIEFCVRYLWDIHSIPRRSFFAQLAQLSTSALEKERLQEFSAAENLDELFNYTSRPRRTILETMRDFPETARQIPLPYLFDLLPPLRPRCFSIASSMTTHAQVLQLLVAVVSYRTRLAKPRRGLCSTWLSQLRPADSIYMAVRKGTFLFPPISSSSDIPCVLIGPGTGVAPLRSFLLHRTNSDPTCANNYLFFGCRYKRADFYFENEWNDLQERGLLFVYPAFSRDDPDCKVYVQDRLREQSALLWKLILQEKAMVFIAGNAKQMPTDVLSTLRDILVDHSALDDRDKKVQFAEEMMDRLEKSKRIQLETWS